MSTRIGCRVSAARAVCVTAQAGRVSGSDVAKQGWTVKVTDRYVFMFGDDARSTGRERLELVVMGRTDLDAVRRERPDLQPIGHAQDTYLFLRRGS
jgi:hypothetical protein